MALTGILAVRAVSPAVMAVSPIGATTQLGPGTLAVLVISMIDITVLVQIIESNVAKRLGGMPAADAGSGNGRWPKNPAITFHACGLFSLIFRLIYQYLVPEVAFMLR